MAAYVEKVWTTGEQITAAKLNTHIMAPLTLLSPSDATKQTTDATVTTLISVSVPTNSALMLYGSVIGERSDHSAALHARFGAVFRRAGGNIALAGSFVTVSEDSASAPTVTIVATAPDLALVRVTGVAGQTWDWKAAYMKATL